MKSVIRSKSHLGWHLISLSLLMLLSAMVYIACDEVDGKNDAIDAYRKCEFGEDGKKTKGTFDFNKGKCVCENDDQCSSWSNRDILKDKSDTQQDKEKSDTSQNDYYSYCKLEKGNGVCKSYSCDDSGVDKIRCENCNHNGGIYSPDVKICRCDNDLNCEEDQICEYDKDRRYNVCMEKDYLKNCENEPNYSICKIDEKRICADFSRPENCGGCGKTCPSIKECVNSGSGYECKFDCEEDEDCKTERHEACLLDGVKCECKNYKCVEKVEE